MKESSAIIHVYCVPGMSAKPTIYEYITLPPEQYEIHWIAWKMPEKHEPLTDYSKRLCAEIKHENPVLIGVSLGGMVVQEMQKYIKVRKLILISTLESKYERPAYMNFGRRTKLYKLLPTSLVKYMKRFESWPLGKFIKTQLRTYNRYIHRDEKAYLDWAIEQVLYWDQEKPLPGVVHIHGDSDHIFPIKYIKKCFTVHGATHLLVIYRFRWLNQHLPSLILTGQLATEAPA